MKVVIIFFSIILSLFSTHYYEEDILPLIVSLKHKLYGEQSYTSALQGCNSLNKEQWVHPATLSLTVYGTVQNILKKYNTDNLPSVLPKYRKNIVSGDELVCVANYLLNNSKLIIEKQRVIARYYEYPIPKPIYNITKPWVSGLAQSFTGQVLLAAYIYTNEHKYLEAAQQVGSFLMVKIKDGGPLIPLDDDNYWFEEYAEKNSKSPMVLNGHLLTLDFLYFLIKIDSNIKWDFLFTKGLNAAVNNIHKFVGSNWSYYDLNLNFANGKYHRFHIRQLDRYELFDSTGKLKMANQTMKNQLLLPLGTIERLITQPSKLLVFIYISFFIIYTFILFILIQIFRKAKKK